jgi:hypothetical protein
MSRWEPHIDLMRLLEALGNEIVATAELEVRQACAEGGWSVRWSVKEVRALIDAVNGDPGEPEIDVENGHIELKSSRHLQSVVEPGSRTYCSSIERAQGTLYETRCWPKNPRKPFHLYRPMV